MYLCVCLCAMPQHKFHCDCSKNRLPDLTSDMCRLLSYRSLNGLVRNHRPDGDRDRKWRYDGEEKLSLSMDEVKVGENPRSSRGVVKLSILNAMYSGRFVRSIAPLIGHSRYLPLINETRNVVERKV